MRGISYISKSLHLQCCRFTAALRILRSFSYDVKWDSEAGGVGVGRAYVAEGDFFYNQEIRGLEARLPGFHSKSVELTSKSWTKIQYQFGEV